MLLEGFWINSLQLFDYKIERLYIKLDKKLHIQIESLTAPKSSNTQTSKDEIVQAVEYLDLFYTTVGSLSIQKISLPSSSYKFLYKYGEFFFSDGQNEIFAKLSKQKDTLRLEIQKSYIPQYKAYLSGTLSTHDSLSFATFKGKLHMQDVQIGIDLFYKNGILQYDLNTQSTPSVEKFMAVLEENIEFEPEISEWIYKKIHPDSYEIKYLKGSIDTKTWQFDPYNIAAKGVAKNAKVFFHPDVKPAHVEQVDVELIENELRFSLTNPTFEGINASGSKVVIRNLLTKGTTINVDIKANQAKFTHTIRSILKAYDIDFGLEQKSGVVDGNIVLDIRFIPYKLHSWGSYFVQDGSFIYLDSLDFNASNLLVKHKDHEVKFESGNIRFQDILDANITQGYLNLREKNFRSNLLINSIKLQEKANPIVNIEDENVDLLVSYKNNLHISVPQIPLDVKLKDETYTFEVDNIQLGQSYFPILQKYQVFDGSITLETDDFDEYFITLDATQMRTPLIKYQKPIQSLHLDLYLDKNGIAGIDRYEGLEFYYSDIFNLTLNDFGIDLTQTSSMLENFGATQTKITAFNSIALLENNRSVIFDTAEVLLDTNMTQVKLTHKDGNLELLKKPQHTRFEMENMDVEFIRRFLKIDQLLDGKYFAKGSIDENSTAQVHFVFEDAYAKNSTVLNNFLSFINTIPSLASFRENYFDSQGFLIKKGTIDAIIQEDLITFSKIYLQGINADFFGNGVANLEQNSINLDMQIATLKPFQSLLGAIPLAGYLLLGDDGNIGLSFSVTGAIDDPVVTTNITQESLLLPLSILKRAFLLPSKIFDNNTSQD